MRGKRRRLRRDILAHTDGDTYQWEQASRACWKRRGHQQSPYAEQLAEWVGLCARSNFLPAGLGVPLAARAYVARHFAGADDG